MEKEKEEINKNKTSQEASIKKLKTELSGAKQKLQETEVSHLWLMVFLIPEFKCMLLKLYNLGKVRLELHTYM